MLLSRGAVQGSGCLPMYDITVGSVRKELLSLGWPLAICLAPRGWVQLRLVGLSCVLSALSASLVTML